MAEVVYQHIDISSLEDYLERVLPDIKRPLDAKQFTTGQSNPTYLLTAVDQKQYVLRKKPPGKLPAKAHRIDREYSIMHGLNGTDIPLPRVYHLCLDASIIGSSFFIMEYLEGRIFTDSTMPNVSPAEKTALWQEAVRILTRIHRIDPISAGLQKFGNPKGYYDRQIRVLGSLSEAQSSVIDNRTKEPIGKPPHLREIIQFFSNKARQPKNQATLVHGDYKIDNLIFHKTDPRIIGVLDWEMATVGDPLSDFCNLTHPFFCGALGQNVESFQSGQVPGLPTREACVKWYVENAGWDPTVHLAWGDAFFAFRTTVMMQSVRARYVQGNTGDSHLAAYHASRVDSCALDTWQLVKGLMRPQSDSKI